MNRKIQRYSIQGFGFNYTQLPSDAFFMDLRVKEGIIYATFLIDPDAPRHERAFYLAKSGEILSDACEFDYLDATMLNDVPAYLFEQKY
jgi:hypothetical protein